MTRGRVTGGITNSRMGSGGMTTRNIWQAIIVTVASLTLASCSSNPNTGSNIMPVMAVVANTGSPQSHAVKGVFGIPLVALVTSNGVPASGVTVTFNAPTTGASGTFAGKTPLTATAISDANGLATSPTFTANGTVGIYTVTASIPGVLTPGNFELTNTTGAPSLVTATAGNGQSIVIQQQFTDPLQVTVVDAGNNPVGNAVVVFTAPATGASAEFSNNETSITALTNASGIATSGLLTANGVAGADNVVASVSGAASATFGLTNLAGGVATLTATAGTPQSAIAGTSTDPHNSFGVPLSVLVTDNQQNPVANVKITFTAPSNAASVVFSSSNLATMSATTNSQGIATSSSFRANTIAGTFTVTATQTGQTYPAADFTLTNWPEGSQYYSFYASGENASAFGPYGVAGSVVISPTGLVLAGEQDYNDAFVVSPEPSGDLITGGLLTLNSTTQQGTLVLDTNNLNLGINGDETFAVQFVNSNHALIAEYDSTTTALTATSSGSLDLQTLPSAGTSNLNGGYAFTLAGVDPFFFPVAYGGVFSISGGGQTLQSGLLDTNDAGLGAPTPVVTTTGVPITGTLTLPDSFGRGTITIPALNYNVLEQSPYPVSLNYYIVGPEVIRIIDVDTGDEVVGSGFGQGANSSNAGNASLGTSIFGVEGTTLANQYGTAGMFTTNASGTILSGVADDNEIEFGLTVPDAPITGTYSVADTGYGNLTIPAGDLGDVSAFGLYMTDPKLNLLDPNNTTDSSGGGALLLDLDTILAGGTGVVIPQTNTSSTFTGQFAFGAQDQNCFFGCGIELDFVGEADVTAGALSTTDVLFSDPYETLGEPTPATIARFDGTPQADPNNTGRFTMLSSNATPNPLNIRPKDAPQQQQFNVVMYQANGNEFLWLDEDAASVFLGSLQLWGSFTTVPSSAAAKTPVTAK